MADIKITDLAAYTDPVSTDVVPIVDIGNDLTKKVSIANLAKNAGVGSAASPSISFDGDNDTGIYQPAADQVALTTAGTERLRITNVGNVGINTSSPQAKLHVHGGNLGTTAGDSVSLGLFEGSTTNNNKLFISNEREVDGTTWTTSSLRLQRVVDVTKMQYIDFTSVRGGVSSAQDIAFGSGGSEFMRITNVGNVGINTSNPITPLHVIGNIRGSLLAGSGNRAVYSDASGSLSNSSSDATLKTDVVTLTEQIETVKQLNPVAYNWIDTEDLGEQREIGFIAQEVEPLIPEVIGVNSDGKLSVDYPKITAVLTKALQEAIAKVEILEQRITDAGIA